MRSRVKMAIAIAAILAISTVLVSPIVPVKELSPVQQSPSQPIYLPTQYKSPVCWVLGVGFTYYLGSLDATCNLGFF